jgi:hypothetical protein
VLVVETERPSQPTHEVDMAAEERAIRRATSLALGIALAAFVAGCFVLPLVFAFPTELAERLAFAAKAGLFVLVWVLIGVMRVSLGRRRSAADIRGSAYGSPSEAIAVPAAFLQNTLEQAVLAVGLYFALAAVAGGPWLALIVVSVALFALGRVLFWRGYRRGASGRALGMALTMTPVLLGYPLVILLLPLGR